MSLRSPGTTDVMPVPAPMLAVIGLLPGPDSEGDYAFEPLWNGARVIARFPGNGTVQLWSQMATDVTAGYPELVEELPALVLTGLPALLDGEIVVLDGAGRPSFEWLQQRMSLHHPAAVEQVRHRTPVRLMLYDVLHLGDPVLHIPYLARRELLDDLQLVSEHVQAPAFWPGMGTEAFAQAVREGWDGVVAKRLASPYLPGRRSRDWIKIKSFPSRRAPDA
ncbi:hypothetical protein AB0D08_36165 [Kitasatospora sp. NPDC048540]|uniref:ATP-dependent DNA ligase n=1 Tax=Kitasatospora sp. NPDC048540 TaxID=3155634 RepID=UPI0033DE8707